MAYKIITRLFRPSCLASRIGESLQLDLEEFHYLNNVIRVKKGQQLELVCSDHELVVINVQTITKKELIFKKIEQYKLTEKKGPDLHVVQCLPKQDKFSEIVRVCTESGVKSFYPVKNEFSANSAGDDQKKVHRWERVALSAASQSKQMEIPYINKIGSLSDLFDTTKPQANVLYIVAWEKEPVANNIKALFEAQSNRLKAIQDIYIIIGSEGGFSQQEINDLKNQNVKSVSLGSGILRTEHAAFYVISQLNYVFS